MLIVLQNLKINNMSIQLYKPNSKNTGAAFTFSIGSNKNNSLPAFYINAISQFSWDADKKIGTFSGNSKNPDKKVNVKLSELECGEFISAIKNRHEYSAFHAYENNSTSIKFSPWEKDVKVSKYDPSSKSYKDSKVKVPAFGLTISKGKGSSFKIGIDPGEVEVLLKLLEAYLQDFIKEKIMIQKRMTSNQKSNSEKNFESPDSVNSESVEEDEFEDVPF
tara:strand:+ start:2717 stop:3376 length:660 start_codon:yes stop_codon:yes gene_type:complete